MLKLSKLADYGTVMLSCMAHRPEQTFSAAELAVRIGVGAPTASKILKLLARGELVQSVRGTHGGYLLARPAAAISLAEVIEALEGPINITDCCDDEASCGREEQCRVRNNWRNLGGAIRHILADVSLADFSQPVFKPSALVRRRRLR